MTGDLRGARVLVVEDDLEIAEVVAEALEFVGCQVSRATNGFTALEMLSQDPGIHVVLLDLMMPVMNGLEVLQHLRADDRLREIPVVVMSVNRGYDAADLGVKEILRKPFGLDHLCAAVAAARPQPV
jgi:two-component system, response regulator, stage 0 sporulation protein F